MYLAKRQVHSVRLFKQSLSSFWQGGHAPSLVKPTNLLPLNSCRRLAADVVDYAVDAFYAVDDVVGDASEQIVGEVCPVGGHPIYRGYGAEGTGEFIGTLIAHYAHALHGEEDSACLPHFFIHAAIAQVLDVDSISLLQHFHFFLAHSTEDADAETGAREWVATDEDIINTQFATYTANFVFE